MISQNHGDCYELKQIVRWTVISLIAVVAAAALSVIAACSLTFYQAGMDAARSHQVEHQ